MSNCHKILPGLCLFLALAACAEERVEVFADRVETTVSGDRTPLVTELHGAVRIRSGDMELSCEAARVDHVKAEVTTLSPVVFRRGDLV